MNKEKGGEMMETLKGKCQFCGQQFETLWPEQLKQWIETHEKHCKCNPSKSENGKA